jgi:hypothetical protein
VDIGRNSSSYAEKGQEQQRVESRRDIVLNVHAGETVGFKKMLQDEGENEVLLDQALATLTTVKFSDLKSARIVPKIGGLGLSWFILLLLPATHQLPSR